MSDERERAGRLGVRTLTRKTVRLVRKLTGRTNTGKKGSGSVDAEVWRAREQPRLVAGSDSWFTLASPTVCDASFADFWIDGKRAQDVQAPEHGQIQSELFGKLPREIREMIYQELWRDAGMGQHIIRTEAGYAHTRCLLHRPGDPEEKHEGGEPWESMWMVPDARGTVPLWYKREMSTWCDHWKCEEAREENEIWKDIAKGCRCVKVDTWTAFLPMMLTCKRMYHECAASIYKSLTFTITDIALATDIIRARNLFGTRHQSPAHPFRRINLSFRRHIYEGRTFEQWVESWSKILRLLDTPDLKSLHLWLDSDVFYERQWLSVTSNVLRRIPEALTHKAAVSLPPDGHRDRVVGATWLSDLEQIPLAPSRGTTLAEEAEQEEAKCFGVRRLRT
ncbi:hypothetical protein CGCA056_v004200 [Colletotrichum aenigma]|uniref:uncharacterized protein n=1 Tax=Colletotrichum aenigma TaxID=1215731 RepID=UPI0018722B28|nr:uncharacterized protein CGCA056_v004200 [Colletotrichum aenigma]KAF5523234.1 hypothetical protein CGCA056_v004200 [Colletotrichum aenigma]